MKCKGCGQAMEKHTVTESDKDLLVFYNVGDKIAECVNPDCPDCGSTYRYRKAKK